jgi:hypothetical protein
MREVDREILDAAGNATRYEFASARLTVIVELVDDSCDEWVVRTTGSARRSEKELVRGRGAALRRARLLRDQA